MLIVDAEVDGRLGQAVRVDGATIGAVGLAGDEGLRPRPGEEVVDARGGLLLPGLHDHHLHLLALAALAASVPAGPPAVRTLDDLARALRAAAARTLPGAWVRAVGYHETVAGDLDAATLDRLVRDIPVRVQHRSGAMWIVNSAGLAALRAAASRAAWPGGALPSDGRLFRADELVGRWLALAGAGATVGAADLAAVGARLAGYGVTGLTDATATTGPAQVDTLRAALETGAIPQRLLLTGPPELGPPELAGAADRPAGRAGPAGHDDAAGPPGWSPRGRAGMLRLGPVKIVLDDDVAVGLDELAATVRAARARGRRVAVHCVTRVQLALALAAFDAGGGTLRGDRIEHAAVLPPDLVGPVAAAGLTVVTQPHFLTERGDAYLADVDRDDLPWLYRCAGPLAAGIRLAAGTDAPFGADDPWASMRAATHRRTPSGQVLGPGEILSPGRALALYLGGPFDPGGPPRRVAPGAAADLCLLAQPGRAVLADLDPGAAALTLVAGTVVHRSR
jgi:predicted amidohydrolase YtcJ